MTQYEYYVYQDDNSMSTESYRELFDSEGKNGWEFVGTVGIHANHLIFKRPIEGSVNIEINVPHPDEKFDGGVNWP